MEVILKHKRSIIVASIALVIAFMALIPFDRDPALTSKTTATATTTTNSNENISLLDQCLNDRFSLPPRNKFTDIRLWAGVIIHGYLFLHSIGFFSSSNQRNSARSLKPPSWAISVVWFQTTYMIIALLREIQGDTRCGRPGKSNGISGHSLHYLYFSLISIQHFLFHTRAAAGGKQSKRTAWSLIGVISVVLLCVAVLIETLMRGFHSIRQMIVGFCFGLIIWICLNEITSLKVYISNLKLRRIFLGLLVFSGMLASFICYHFTSLPISTQDFILFLTALIFVFFDLENKLTLKMKSH